MANEYKPSDRSRSFLGPALTLKELNLICWGLFFALLVLPFCTVVVQRTVSGHPLVQDPEVDFIYVYGMGRILNDHRPAELYTYDSQERAFTATHHLKAGKYGPVFYAPFIAILFRPLALLPYTTAYLIWVCTALLLYLGGLTILTGRFFPNDGLWRSLIFCFALSYYPFVNWTLMSGHIPVIGFLALAAAFSEEAAGRSYTSGLALSVCSYKPTLLLLFVPLLFVGKRWKNLAAFCTGTACLVLFSTAVEGTDVWQGYLGGLFSYGAGSTYKDPHSFKQLWKYVDLASLLAAQHGVAFLLLAVAAGVSICWVGLALTKAWLGSSRMARSGNMLLWASTLTFTLVLNIYVPIYDSILVVIAAIVAAAVFREVADRRAWRRFVAVCLLILASSWFAVQIAEATGFQMITVLIAILGFLQLAQLKRMTDELPVTGDSA